MHANKCMVVINVATPAFRHANIAGNHRNVVGDAIKYCHMHIIGLPQSVMAERPAARSDWLLRLHTAADRAGWDTAVQHLAAVYAHCQSYMLLGGHISAMTGAGWYQWNIGMPPSWQDISGKTSFSKLDMNRTGGDQGNVC